MVLTSDTVGAACGSDESMTKIGNYLEQGNKNKKQIE